IDPCAPPDHFSESLDALRANKGCLVQLRLILHPVVSESALGDDILGGKGEESFESSANAAEDHSEFTTPDDALHLIYDVARGAFPAGLWQDLQDLKAASPVATDPMTLGVHPGLFARDPAAVAFAAKVTAFLEKWALASALESTAVLAVSDFNGKAG